MLAARSTSGALSDAEREGLASPIEELLAAINSEKPRDRREAPQPIAVAPPPPPVPSRAIEQMTQPQAPAPAIYAQAPQPQRPGTQPAVTRTRQDIDPALAKFLGIRIPDQQPQPAQPRRREATALPR